ncbi:DUF6099 family protein [Streptomyces sp. NPDC006879]|uniref:DUF6099 family protein n=1 Tax=Streptomyces sp. NPDC006879 TaxID=3364767 RepID=UPI0036A760B6
MDAVRLIAAGRHALAQSQAALDIVTEAWQCQALAHAVGGWLAIAGPAELRGEARGLSEAGGRGCGRLDPLALAGSGKSWDYGSRLPEYAGKPPDYAPRAAQLTEVRDPRQALLGLGALLGELGIALVAVACATDEEGLYWQCMEAIDAADESNDRVRSMLRRLTTRERGGASGAARDSTAGAT